jgi:hypothetical protein
MRLAIAIATAAPKPCIPRKSQWRAYACRSGADIRASLEGWDAGPVLDDRSASHPARCRDPAAGERFIETTRLRNGSKTSKLGMSIYAFGEVTAEAGSLLGNASILKASTKRFY